MIGRNLRVLLFDLGGTLYYEKEPWPPIFARAEKALKLALEQGGVRLENEIYQSGTSFLDFYNQRRERRTDFMEEVSRDLLKELLVQHGYSDVPEQTIHAALRAMYAVTQTNWIPEQDALPVLHSLRAQGYRLGLVSNAADDENTQQLIDKGGLRPLVEFIISSAVCGLRKPHPHIFQLALDHFQVKPSETAMIGDALEADILGANQLGIFSIWITRRAQPTDEDLKQIQPNARVDTLLELPGLLKKI